MTAMIAAPAAPDIRKRRPCRPAALLASIAGLWLAGCAVTPEPIPDAEHIARARTEYAQLFSGQTAPQKPLTLAEAIARGLKYNYDQRLSLMEEALQDRQLTLANFNMLPRLAANAGYTLRDRERASSSIQFETRRLSLEPSVSEDQGKYTADATFSWSLLDFGLSYFQAQQQADRALIAVERRRRVMNNMVKEIRAAYARAASAQRLMPEIDRILAEVGVALENSAQIEREQLSPPIEALEYRRSLLQVVSQLRRLRSEMSVARSQLAALISLPPGEAFTLADDDTKGPGSLATTEADIRALEMYGLSYRPELREEAYQERIDRINVRKEILRLFPAPTLQASTNYDSNSFLVENFWNEIGLRMTWNLIGLVQGPKAIDVAETQVEVSKARRLALSVAVMTQINIGYQQLRQSLTTLETATELAEIEGRIHAMTQDQASLNAAAELERIRRGTQSIAAQLEEDRARNEVQSAISNLLVSLGLDPVPASVATTDLDQLTGIVQTSLDRMRAGTLTELIALPEAPQAAEPQPAPEAAPPAAAPAPAVPVS